MHRILHIGANKTASTTLQRQYFCKSDALEYLGEDCFDYLEHRDALNSLVADDDIHFDSTRIKEIFSRFLARRPDRTHLFSNEDIMTGRLPTVCADRLKGLLGEATVLLVIRNQVSALESWYANHGAYLKQVPRRYWRRYVAFEDWASYCFDFMNYSVLDSYFYHRFISLYADRFGKENVRILMFEDLIRDPKKFIGELCSVLKTDPEEATRLLAGKKDRRRNTHREYLYHKFRGRFFPSIHFSSIPGGKLLARGLTSFLSKGRPAGGYMTQSWKEKFADLYREDNRKLAKEYNLPLGEAGYPI
ncbi:MAG: sulfotransferase domain-containing protein [Leptospirales bacterium]|nr:sulfotransferase domain-containing protein [Leptospirales bacterium]